MPGGSSLCSPLPLEGTGYELMVRLMLRHVHAVMQS